MGHVKSSLNPLKGIVQETSIGVKRDTRSLDYSSCETEKFESNHITYTGYIGNLFPHSLLITSKHRPK